MVKYVLYFMMVLSIPLFFPTSVHSDDTKVTAEIDDNQGFENQPLSGTISITHNKNDTVDLKSFRLEKEPLSVDFVKDVQFDPSQPLILSIYKFQMPGKPQGLYLLPKITVRIGSKDYQSTMSSYSVGGGTPTPAPSVPSYSPSAQTPASQAQELQKNSAPGDAVLRLEAKIEGKSELYPGQRTTVAYFYYYKGNIELATEKLPLLDAEGMIKIGEKVFKDYTEGDLSVSEISQVVEAQKVGNFSYGPSLIEGYVKDAYGRRTSKLSSEAPPVVVKVLPFPGQEKPASFNGAVGQFTFKVSLQSPPQVTVGDEITLLLTVSGKGNLKSVPMPDLCCQPGFSGFFQPSDLPPVEKVEGDTKTATVILRPLSDQVTEIPSVEFSYFNLETSLYTTLHSEPIPLTVKPGKAPPPENLDKTKQPANKTPEVKKVFKPMPIEIGSNVFLQQEDLHDKWFGTWWALSIIPIGAALLAFLIYLRNYLDARSGEVIQEKSVDILKQAYQEPEGSPAYFDLIQKALIRALYENNLVTSPDITSEGMPEEGLAGEVRALLANIEERRFSGSKKLDFQELRQQVSAIVEKIRGPNAGVNP